MGPKMADMNTLMEGTLKFREGKKWKRRWCVIRKLSPVADQLHIYLYKDEHHTAQEKCMFPLEGFYGIESNFSLDKEQHVMAILCHSQVALLAFCSREVLIRWKIKIRDNLGEERQFPVKLLRAPLHSTVSHGPVKIYIQGDRFCLTRGVPPKILQSWHVHDLRKFGVVDNKFAFDTSSRSGKGAGVHVFMTDFGQEITDLLKQAASNKPERVRKSSTKRQSHVSQQSLSSNQSNLSTTESFRNMFDVPDIYSDLSLKSQSISSRRSSVDLGLKSQSISSRRSSVVSGSSDLSSLHCKLINHVNTAVAAQPIKLQNADLLRDDVKLKDGQLSTRPNRCSLYSQSEVNVSVNASLAASVSDKPNEVMNNAFLCHHQANKQKSSSLEMLPTNCKNLNCFSHKLPKCCKKDLSANGLSFKRMRHIPVCEQNGLVGQVLENDCRSRDLVNEILKIQSLKDLKWLRSKVIQSQESCGNSECVEAAVSNCKQSNAGRDRNIGDDFQGKHDDYVNQFVLSAEAESSSKNTESKPNQKASFHRSFTEPSISKSVHKSSSSDDASLPVNAPLPGLDFSRYDGDENNEYGHKPIVKYSKDFSNENKPNYTNWPCINSGVHRTSCENKDSQCNSGAVYKLSHTYTNLACAAEECNKENFESEAVRSHCPEGYHDMKVASGTKMTSDQLAGITDTAQFDGCVCKPRNLNHAYENLPGIQKGNNCEVAPSGASRFRDYKNLPCKDTGKLCSNRTENISTKIPINGDLFELPVAYKGHKTCGSANSKTSSMESSTKVPLERESTYMITNLPLAAANGKPKAFKEADYMLMQPSTQKLAVSPVLSRPLSDIKDDEEIFCAVDLPIRRAESCKSYCLQRDGNYLLMSGKQSDEANYMQMNLGWTQNYAGLPNCRLPMRSQSVEESSGSHPKFSQFRSMDGELEDNLLDEQHNITDEVKIVKPFDNLIQHRQYSSVKVSPPPEIPHREPCKSDVPSRQNSVKSSQELEKNSKNRKFPWFQRRNSSRENSSNCSGSSGNSKSGCKSQEDILSCGDGTKNLSSSAPSEQTSIRLRSGSAELLSITDDSSRERSTSVPNKNCLRPVIDGPTSMANRNWLGPVIDTQYNKAQNSFNNCYSTLPLCGSHAVYLEEVRHAGELACSRSSSDVSDELADLPPPPPPPIPPRNPNLSSKNKLNATGRSITPPSAVSVQASSTPDNTNQVSNNSTCQYESPASLRISEESLNLSEVSMNSSNSTGSTGIDTSNVSNSSHSFICGSENSYSSKSSAQGLPHCHNSVQTYQPANVVSGYTRHGSLERTSKSSHMSVMSGSSSLRRGCSHHGYRKKPPALVVEIPWQSASKDIMMSDSRDDSGCVWMEGNTPKSATPTCFRQHLEERRIRSPNVPERKSISDTSDLVDTISWSSMGSTDTAKSEDSQMVSPSYTTLRPRSGKEYQKIDRKKLLEDLSPVVSPVASVFTFDRISVESAKLSLVSGISSRHRCVENNYMNVNFPRDGKYTSDPTPPDSPFSPSSADLALLNYAEIDLIHMEKAKKRPRRLPQARPSSTEYAIIDMVATTTASRVGREHAHLREDILKRKEESRDAMLAQNKDGSLKRKDRKSLS